MKYRIILKGAVMLLIVSVLLFSNLSVATNISRDSSIKTDHTNEKLNAPSTQPTGTIKFICEENFTSDQVPPTGGKYGDWTNESFSNGLTWISSTNHPNSEPRCAEVRRGFNVKQSDEWLITPSMDFSKITDTRVFMDFWFRAHFYTASPIFEDNVDLNVKVSTNNGGEWDTIWNEDYITDNVYTDWEGHEIKELELSKYRGNASVLIAFQFVTSNNKSRKLQYFYLDDVYVYNESDIELTIKHGGPYHWDILRQLDYTPKGVRFHGDIVEYPYYACSWYWEFGDGNDSFKYFDPDAINFYDEIGVYKINLTVTHITLGLRKKVNTTLTLFAGEPPDIDITLKKLSIGVKAEIISHESINATFVKWKIDAEWPPILRNRGGVIGEGEIENLEPNEKENIKSITWWLKAGFIYIVITLMPENIANVTKTFFALKIGPFIIGATEV